MSCSSVMTGTLAFMGIMLSITSLYVTRMLKEERFDAPCDMSPTLSCTEFLRLPHSTGYGVISTAFGTNHPANLPNSVFSMIIYALVLLTSCTSSMAMTTIALMFSSTLLLANISVAAISLPLMCPISLASLCTMLFMTLALLCLKSSLAREKDGPKTINNNKQAFKKFI